MPDPAEVAAAALAAYAAGCAVVPPREDGTKAPIAAWKPFQAVRPDLAQVETWYGNGTTRHGIGFLCGATSGGLELLELEGAAVTGGLQARFREICDAAGYGDVLTRVTTGCTVRSPSGGYHLMYRCPAPGPNTKLASRLDPVTGEITLLAETRGEGGYVVTAPSHGPVHPSGEPWVQVAGSPATMATLTQVERDGLISCAQVLDEMPASRARPASAKIDDRPGDLYNAAPDAHGRTLAVLTGAGWEVVGAKAPNTLLRRPGKTVGISATLRDDGTFYCFTTSTVFPAGAHSPFAVLALLAHGGDWSATARTLKPLAPTTGPRLLAATVYTAEARPHNIPADWWQARPELDWIRQAAHSRNRSADAVLHVVLARVAAHIPHRYRIPAIVGGDAGLSYVVGLVGGPGTGKSTANQIGGELLPTPDKGPPVLDGLPLGSGEGLAEMFYEQTKDDKGKVTKVQTRHNAYIYVDEGQVLTELGGRKGSNLLPTLRTIWTGGTIGQTNASAETRRRLDAGTYTIGVVMGFQPTVAAGLLGDALGGTPQRFTWAATVDPATGTADWPGHLHWQPPQEPLIGGARYNYLDVTASVTTEIRGVDLAKARGQLTLDLLDAHRDLLRLKIAALLALLAERTDVSVEDWQLGGVALDTSDAVRTGVQVAITEHATAVETAKATAEGRRRIIVEEVATDAALDRVTKLLTGKITEEWVTRKALRHTLASRDYEWFDEALRRLLDDHQIEARDIDNAGRAGRPGTEYRSPP